jgi:sugar-specific transcriptional regulator TrmB
LTQEWMFKTLENLGFKRVDAEVYLFLTMTGPQKARNIANALRLQKQQLYRSLKTLQNRGMVHASLESPAYFSAVQLDIVVDSLAKAKKEQVITLQQSKEELLLCWREITNKNNLCS